MRVGAALPEIAVPKPMRKRAPMNISTWVEPPWRPTPNKTIREPIYKLSKRKKGIISMESNTWRFDRLWMKWLTIIANRRPRRSVSWKAIGRAQIPPTCWIAFNRPSWEELGLWKSKKWSRENMSVRCWKKTRLQRKSHRLSFHYYLQPVQVSNTWRPCWWKSQKEKSARGQHSRTDRWMRIIESDLTFIILPS